MEAPEVSNNTKEISNAADGGDTMINKIQFCENEDDNNIVSSSSTTQPPASFSIRMVVQRYRKANVLINESKVVTVGGRNECKDESLLLHDERNNGPASVGLLSYISFAKTANTKHVEEAAKTLMNLPVLTLGEWGDGSKTKSILELASEVASVCTSKAPLLSIVVVPQANVISKVKRLGKSIQYHEQIDKSRGEELYRLFVDAVANLLRPNINVGNSFQKASMDPAIPPHQLFRRTDGSSTYASFDGNGIPLTTFGADGEEQMLTKSARKKLQKVHNAYVTRHEKYLVAKGKTSNGDTTGKSNDGRIDTIPIMPTLTQSIEEVQPLLPLEDNVVTLVAGTFGRRQGIEIFSDMGPFCHVIEI